LKTLILYISKKEIKDLGLKYKFMHKSLISELKDLAQEILSLDNGTEVDILRKKTHELFEKLIVLEYLSKEPETIPEEAIIEQEIKIEEEVNLESSIEETQKKDLSEKFEVSESEQEDEPVRLENLFIPTFDSIKDDMSQKEEFKDTISLDETEKLFGTKKEESKQLSLNDKLLSSSIQIGLNDRIAFVNQLFNFSQSDFNSVLGSLNTYKNKQEALNYIQYSVKPKYNWKGKEELEERFILIIERKFL